MRNLWGHNYMIMSHNYVLINCYTDSNKQYYYCMFKPSFRDSYNFNFTLLLENSVLGIVCDISLHLFNKVESQWDPTSPF